MPPDRKPASIADELATERTVIRPYQPADAEALYRAVVASRDHIGQWLSWAYEHTSPQYTRDLIGSFQEQWRQGEVFTYGVFDRASGALLGGLGLHPRDWNVPSFEIGYWLAADAEGHGYMTEAASALVDYLLRDLGARRIEIRCNVRNTRSAAVARRLGFTQEGLIHNDMRLPDGALRDTLIFARWVV